MVFDNYDFDEDFRTIGGVLISDDRTKTAWFENSEGNLLAIGSSC